MLSVEHYEAIRRAYYIEKKSVRQIARELQCSRKTVDKALASATPATYTRTVPYESPKLGPFKPRIAELLAEREQQPPKQRYTSTKLYEILRAEGYQGSEARLRGYLGSLHWRQPRVRSFFPLEFDPGQDAQVDWGEAVAVIAGARDHPTLRPAPMLLPPHLRHGLSHATSGGLLPRSRPRLSLYRRRAAPAQLRQSLHRRS